MKKIIKELTELNGISSKEKKIKDYIYKYNEDVTKLDVIEDNNLSIGFFKPGKGKKIMVMAHMDEVGFMVKHITPQGHLIVIPIGNVRNEAKHSQNVIVETQNGEKYSGILNFYQDLYVDLACDSDVEVIEKGIDIGDMVIFGSQFTELSPNRFMSKALDNRLGCAVNLALMKENKCDNIYYAFTSLEEVGMRGAQTLTSVIKPDYAIIVDVACSKNEFDRSYKNNRQLGKGPFILHYDKNMLPNTDLLKIAKDTAVKNNIPYQKDMFVNGGTDGAAVHLQNGGIPTVVIGIPNRYGHGPYSMADMDDIKNCVNLIKLVIEEVQTNEA